LIVSGLILMAAVSGCRKTPVNVTTLPGYKPQNVGEGNPGTPINTNDGAGPERWPTSGRPRSRAGETVCNGHPNQAWISSRAALARY